MRWPSAGPDGDYLRPVLVEGKTIRARCGRVCTTAKDPVSCHRILALLAEARAWLDVSEGTQSTIEALLPGSNRIAFLYWFHKGS